MIDDAIDYTQAEPALRRLSMAHATLALDRATSMVAPESKILGKLWDSWEPYRV